MNIGPVELFVMLPVLALVGAVYGSGGYLIWLGTGEQRWSMPFRVVAVVVGTPYSPFWLPVWGLVRAVAWLTKRRRTPALTIEELGQQMGFDVVRSNVLPPGQAYLVRPPGTPGGPTVILPPDVPFPTFKVPITRGPHPDLVVFDDPPVPVTVETFEALRDRYPSAELIEQSDLTPEDRPTWRWVPPA